MKRIVHLLFLGSTIFVAGRCRAQQQKYIGVILGGNFASEAFDAQPAGISESYRTGIVAGVQIERWFSPQWAISTHEVYVQQGHNDKLNQTVVGGTFNGTTKTGTDNIETNSLNVDLLLKRTIWGNDAIRTYVFAGPSVGIILSGKEYLNDTVKTSSVWYVGDTTYEMSYSNTLDWSLVLGLGISAQLNSGPMFFLDAGYWYGLTNLYDWEGGAVYTRDIRLTAGVQFPIHLPSLW